MEWKEWPYWLKGGIIFLILDILFLLVLFMFAFINKDIEGLGFGLLFTQLPAIIIFKPLIFGGMIFEIILMTLFGLIGYFLIGSIIGWIIALITSKDKKNSVMNPAKRSIIKKGAFIGMFVGVLFSLIISLILSQIQMHGTGTSFSEIFISNLISKSLFLGFVGLVIGVVVGMLKSRGEIKSI